jgi:hypothetical protein
MQRFRWGAILHTVWIEDGSLYWSNISLKGRSRHGIQDVRLPSPPLSLHPTAHLLVCKDGQLYTFKGGMGYQPISQSLFYFQVTPDEFLIPKSDINEV